MDTFLWWFGLLTMIYGCWMWFARMFNMYKAKYSGKLPNDLTRFQNECRVGLAWAGIGAGAVLMAVFG